MVAFKFTIPWPRFSNYISKENTYSQLQNSRNNTINYIFSHKNHQQQL